MATSGQFCWPPTGSSYWPLTCGGLDERPSFVGIGDYPRGGRNVGLDALLQMHDDVGVCGDVVYPVPCAVSTRHPGDEQHAVLIVQEDLNAAR
jgi:hypothetical protein